MNEKEPLNALFAKQLKKNQLSSTSLPVNLESWRTFLSRINLHYNDTAQERYILERSSEIAARETMMLNKNLETAQRLASIGRWHYNISNDQITFSKEFNPIFGLDLSRNTITYSDMIKTLHVDDKKDFVETINSAISNIKDTECDVRVILPTKEFAWFHIICHPLLNNEGVCEGLTGIGMEITKRKEAEEKITQLNKEVIISARYAGMAEVAVTMLHNLGNVLNSANVSLNILNETINHSYILQLLKIVELLKENFAGIDVFLTQDPKGKLIPKYLIELSTLLNDEHNLHLHEIDNLKAHLDHVKEIVATQTNIAEFTALIEKVFLSEIIDLALKLSSNEMIDKNIKIKKEFLEADVIEIDKGKLLQILVNLIQNAKESTLERKGNDSPEVTISVIDGDNNRLNIIVKDNGIGVAPENHTRIFGFGFTTKKQGHGFGLHSCALFAKEIGGDLQVISEGIGKGASFILTIPVNQAEGRSHERE